MEFDWDSAKALENLAKHGISFQQAIKAFDDPDAIFFDDPEHSEGEARERLLGIADESGVVLVVFTVRDGDVYRNHKRPRSDEEGKANLCQRLSGGRSTRGTFPS